MIESPRDLTKILLVDDDDQIRRQLRWALEDRFQVHTAGSRSEAIRLVRDEQIRLVLLDLGLPPSPRDASEGLRALEEILDIDVEAKVIIVSGNSDRASAVEAVQSGAWDIFAKPIEIKPLRVVLERVERRLELEAASRRPSPVTDFELIGESEAIQKVLRTIRKVASTHVPVLITGESGTGKELIARDLHRLSARREGPFVPINCAAIPEALVESELFGHEKGAFTGATRTVPGRIELSHGGTLFLDEIGELPASEQSKLLRFLQEGETERVGGREIHRTDARVVAATNVDLQRAVAEGKFREDLYYRLEGLSVELPPLRERDEDAGLLADHFALIFSKEFGKPARRIGRAAREAILRYPWPGNVRELANRVRRAVVLSESPTIGVDELDLGVRNRSLARAPAPKSGATLREVREQVEREMVAQALEKHRGNVSRAARELGTSRPTLYELIDRYQLR